AQHAPDVLRGTGRGGRAATAYGGVEAQAEGALGEIGWAEDLSSRCTELDRRAVRRDSQ
ncbi:hypothetical protein KI387_043269, partial [Taxus chinensis]